MKPSVEKGLASHSSIKNVCTFGHRKLVEWVKLINYVADDAYMALYKGYHNLFQLSLKDCMERKVCNILALFPSENLGLIVEFNQLNCN